MRLNYLTTQTLTDTAAIIALTNRIRRLFRVSLYRNAIFLVLNSAIPAVTGFIFWTVATRLYPPEGIGIAAATISVMTLLMFISTLGLDYGLIRFLPNSGGKAREIMNSALTTGGLVSLVLSTVFVAGIGFWTPSLVSIQQHPIFPVAFVVFTTAFTLHSLVHHALVARRRAGFTLVQTVVFSLLRFVPLIFLAGSFKTFGIFASWGCALGTAMVVGIIFFLPRVQAGYRPSPGINRSIIKDLMRFSSANWVTNLLWMTPSLLLPIMVTSILGAESNAYFYIGWAVANLALAVPLSISLSLFAEGSNNQQQLVRDVVRSLKLILLITIPAIIFVFLAGSKILLLFGASYSENATGLLRILVISTLPAGINYIYCSIRRIETRMKSVVFLSALIAVTTLTLSFFLLPEMGILGAGISYLIAQALPACGISLWLVKAQHRLGQAS